MVKRLEMDSEQADMLLLDLLHPQGVAGTNPREILEKVLGLAEEQSQLVRIVKWRSQEVD